MKISLVPNTEADKRGAASYLLATIEPIMERGKQLKRSNRKLYKTIKFALNVVLVAILAAIVFGIVRLTQYLL